MAFFHKYPKIQDDATIPTQNKLHRVQVTTNFIMTPSVRSSPYISTIEYVNCTGVDIHVPVETAGTPPSTEVHLGSQLSKYTMAYT